MPPVQLIIIKNVNELKKRIKQKYNNMCWPYFLFVQLHADQTFSEYDQKIPQSLTADQPTAPRGRDIKHQQPQDI